MGSMLRRIRGHTLYCGIVTEARAAAAERDGFTERPWRGGARGACGIRRFNHPRRERDGGIGSRRAREREMRCRAIDRLADHAHPGETRAR
ncbi:unnamed protein product, partial [Iphiclides podalirius]